MPAHRLPLNVTTPGLPQLFSQLRRKKEFRTRYYFSPSLDKIECISSIEFRGKQGGNLGRRHISKLICVVLINEGVCI